MAGNSIGIIRAFYRLGVRYVSALHLTPSKSCKVYKVANPAHSALLPMCVIMLSRTVPPPKSAPSMEDYQNSESRP
jgi:hypothetical protein